MPTDRTMDSDRPPGLTAGIRVRAVHVSRVMGCHVGNLQGLRCDHVGGHLLIELGDGEPNPIRPWVAKCASPSRTVARYPMAHPVFKQDGWA